MKHTHSVKKLRRRNTLLLIAIMVMVVNGHSAWAQITTYTENAITTAADGAYSVYAIDMDGDGDMDVLSASNNDDKIAWYENDGSESFTTHTITTAADGASSVYAIDMDGDGDIDVLSANYGDDKIVWYENDGSESFTTHTITTAAEWAHSVYAIDMDGDGDIDVLSASRYDDKIAWYENDGSENFTTHTITTATEYANSVYAIDMDGDGDIDVLSASSGVNKVAWYENDGSESFTMHTINATDYAFSVYAIDMDGDGDIDVLSANYSDDKIIWYENDGSESFTTHVISTTADGAMSVYAIDMDGDGVIDVLSASNNDDKIALYEAVSYTFPGGVGTSNDPYQIADPTDLYHMRFALTDTFLVTSDIDMNVVPYNTGEGWEPVGDNSRGQEFQGVFDGNGYTISNLFINRPSENFVGLFGATFGGVVKNVALKDVNITGSSFTAALVGINYSDVLNSYATGTVSAVNHSGGLVGTIENYQTSTAEITDSYSLVNVTSSGGNFGGLVGRIISGEINTSYAAGSVTGGTDANGGLVGLNQSGTVTNSYWDTETSGQASSDGGTGLTSAQMKQRSSFSGFDFVGTWFIDEGSGYPKFQEQKYDELIISGNEGWRMLSSPVSSTSYGTLLDTLWTQGFTGADVSHGSSNVYTWNESTNAFQSISNATDMPVTGSGFITYIYSDDNDDGTPEGFPKALTNSGSQFTGTANPTITYTDSGEPANDGWNLLGNPYGTSIDWDRTNGWERTNLDGSIYVWSDSAGGGSGAYLSWNGATGTLENGEIAPWQGFWVKANAADPSISISDSVKSIGGTFFKKVPSPQLKLKLTDGDKYSNSVVMFSEKASEGKDEMDAYKLQSLNDEYLLLGTSLNGNALMDIQALPLKGSTFNLELDISGNHLEGDFTLSWDMKAIPEEWKMVLIDRELGTEKILNGNSSISFELLQPENSQKLQPDNSPKSPIQMAEKAKIGQSRFMLRVTTGTSVSNELSSNLPTNVELQQNYPNPFNPSTNIAFSLPESGKVRLEVFDLMGRRVATLLNGVHQTAGYHSVTFNASGIASGMYLYRLSAGHRVITKKLTLIK